LTHLEKTIVGGFTREPRAIASKHDSSCAGALQGSDIGRWHLFSTNRAAVALWPWKRKRWDVRGEFGTTIAIARTCQANHNSYKAIVLHVCH
jgi:hypothetical protein